jgi:hypothetical protein
MLSMAPLDTHANQLYVDLGQLRLVLGTKSVFACLSSASTSLMTELPRPASAWSTRGETAGCARNECAGWNRGVDFTAHLD